jgi:hypothetical protein
LKNTKDTDVNYHRLFVQINSVDQWYKVMQECRIWFNDNWRAQGRVKRRFNRKTVFVPVTVWFDVPDVKWATWVSTKLSIVVLDNDKHKMQ